MSDKKSLLPALITQAIYYVLFILSMFDYGYSGEGYGPGFILWMISLLPAFLSICFHILGAILNITHTKKIFPIIYLILAILALPLLFTIGTEGSISESIIWNLYFGVLFLIPFFSFWLCKPSA